MLLEAPPDPCTDVIALELGETRESGSTARIRRILEAGGFIVLLSAEGSVSLLGVVTAFFCIFAIHQVQHSLYAYLQDYVRTTDTEHPCAWRIEATCGITRLRGPPEGLSNAQSYY
jgi:hypothetical protein